MNTIRKKNLTRAATSALIFIVIIVAVDFFYDKFDPIWLYLLKSLVFFLVYYTLECTCYHPVNETKEEHEAKDLAIIESIKKQTEPFRGKEDAKNAPIAED